MTEPAFMEFTLWTDPMYRGPTVNWVDVDKSKLYSHPKFSWMNVWLMTTAESMDLAMILTSTISRLS